VQANFDGILEERKMMYESGLQQDAAGLPGAGMKGSGGSFRQRT
jgi:hypothetical protein